MKFPFGTPLIGKEEKDAVMSVMDGPILVHGPRALQFEEAFSLFTGAPFTVSVSSCTAGMHLIYFALGLGGGDEVIVPAQTHVATAHAIELTGARAIFVDVDRVSGNVNAESIRAAITPSTRAIAVVHYLGVPVDMPEIVAIAKKHKLFLLEDCALAPGTKLDGVHAGLHGDAGVFSFYPVKHLTTAEGGMIVLKDPKLAEKLRLLKAFGVNRTHGDRKVPGLYDVTALGFNYRMSEIHAAIGIEQLKKLPLFLTQRMENHQRLESSIQELDRVKIMPQPINERFCSSHYCLGLMLDKNLAEKRPEVMSKLADKGVGTSIYYPHPVPRLEYYRERYGYDEGNYKNAASISDQIIALPVGPHLNIGDMDEIANAVNLVIRELYV